MVAYSFQRRFIDRIEDGTKSQTIRADRRRHARPGEQLQLYFGMRTKHCRLLARRRCIDVLPISLLFDDDPEYEGIILPGLGLMSLGLGSLDEFAIADGFEDWAELKAFWREQHGDISEFEGVLIRWEPSNG